MTKIKFYYVMFFVMLIVGIYINPMNVLAYRFNDFYISLTLIYGGLWHQICYGHMKLFIY